MLINSQEIFSWGITLLSLPTLDCHAHIDPSRTASELETTGNVLAMTLSLHEAEKVVTRDYPHIVWGVGCHPRRIEAQEAFNSDLFGELVEKASIVGEIGLDKGSKVPLELQLSNFRQILDILADKPRFVSIHSYEATTLVIEELEKRPIPFPVLHWWTGKVAETEKAVELDCYFSVHSAVARHSKFRTRVPPERLLIETDMGYGDPPAAIPCRIEWVEHLLAQQLQTDVKTVRSLAWKNLKTILLQSKTTNRFPKAFTDILKDLNTKSSLDNFLAKD
jgi:TatD DNase family protein